jgi:hypothetical protein
MRAAFDGRVKFGDTLIVIADVVVAVEAAQSVTNDAAPLRITHQKGQQKTWELRSRVIATLRERGPSWGGDVLNAAGVTAAPERKKALQLLSRMVDNGELAHARADKGKLRRRYQLPAGA